MFLLTETTIFFLMIKLSWQQYQLSEPSNRKAYGNVRTLETNIDQRS